MSGRLEKIILKKALELIELKKCWARHAASRSPSGRVVNSYSSIAVRYCAFAALAKEASNVCGDATDAKFIVENLEKKIMVANARPAKTRLSTVNDEEGHAAVVRLLTNALLKI